MGDSDAVLLKRWAARRDAEAFAELVRRHSGMVYRTCLRVLGNSADAEDAAQESFLSLVRVAQEEERLPASLGGWLHSVAVCRALDRMRSEGRRRAREDQSTESLPLSHEPHYDDLLEYVDEIIATLPDELRYPLVRHFLEGASHADVAREMGLARRTVTSRIERAVETVRVRLSRRGVVVSSAVLASALAAESAHAAPAALAATLGKIAVTGATGAPAAIPAALAGVGGVLMVGKKVTVLVVGIVLILAGWFARDGVDGVAARVRAVFGGSEAQQTVATAHAGKIPVPGGTQQKNGRKVSSIVAAPAGSSSAAAGARPLVQPAAQPEKKHAEAGEDTDQAWAVLEGIAMVGTEPLAGERVQLMYSDGATPINAKTDDQGFYRFERLSAGEVQAVTGFYDETGQFRYAERWALLEVGLTTRLDFTFPATGALEGVVRLDGAAPQVCWVNAQVLQATGAMENYDVKADLTGAYRINALSEGTARVMAKVVGQRGVSRKREATAVIKAGSVTRLDFEVDSTEGLSIVGHVSGLAPGEQSTVCALPGLVEVPTTLSLVRFREINKYSVAGAAVGPPEGDFRIEGLAEGTYTVVAIAITGEQVNEMLNWRIASGTVTVVQGEEARLDFDLTGGPSAPPVLTGAVEGIEPGEHAVLLILDGEVEVPDRMTTESLASLTDRPAGIAEFADDGTFAAGRLKPGTYTLVAIAGAPQEGVPRAVGVAVTQIVEGTPTEVQLVLKPVPAAEEKGS